MRKGSCFPIKLIKPAPKGANPEVASVIFIHQHGGIVTQAGGIGRVMLIAGEFLRLPIKFIETLHRSNPESTRAVFTD